MLFKLNNKIISLQETLIIMKKRMKTMMLIKEMNIFFGRMTLIHYKTIYIIIKMNKTINCLHTQIHNNNLPQFHNHFKQTSLLLLIKFAFYPSFSFFIFQSFFLFFLFLFYYSLFFIYFLIN